MSLKRLLAAAMPVPAAAPEVILVLVLLLYAAVS